ncbi:hypothetical protein CEXT_114321 [Caerostris extrusa]|uniref:Uncharacterized protein n=1 Tax=Caerostris extrusa TaxID=172846 RepID=A0AAV4Y8V4_CAEEX|nr:hypothetical protein CEXT_114321 [Caerostris extrusa]
MENKLFFFGFCAILNPTGNVCRLTFPGIHLHLDVRTLKGGQLFLYLPSHPHFLSFAPITEFAKGSLSQICCCRNKTLCSKETEIIHPYDVYLPFNAILTPNGIGSRKTNSISHSKCSFERIVSNIRNLLFVLQLTLQLGTSKGANKNPVTLRLVQKSSAIEKPNTPHSRNKNSSPFSELNRAEGRRKSRTPVHPHPPFTYHLSPWHEDMEGWKISYSSSTSVPF